MADILLHILAVVAAMAVSAGIALPVFVQLWKWHLRSEYQPAGYVLYMGIASALIGMVTVLVLPTTISILIENTLPGPLGRGAIAIACISAILVTVSVPYYRQYRALLRAMNHRRMLRRNQS
ncbi:hypothetical protein [Kordiimonas marina]|uniref:hypothetical protein n=1 Tax=Kordiimonas marina TaxID=2872312 RepID=UPI001FF6C389|nr:hypothetical protein [Kordiimonas marina]MCJ9428152.1 hypothetical protein [Kordiimonas marina]